MQRRASGQARGEFCVIYGADDRPDPGQLRKAVAAFRRLPMGRLRAGRAALPEPDTSSLTQFSAAENTAGFVFLRRLGLATPLASTSNHFRVEALRRLGAWDPYNPPGTDLGVRIPRRGWGVQMIASETRGTNAGSAGGCAAQPVDPWVTARPGWCTCDRRTGSGATRGQSASAGLQLTRALSFCSPRS